MHHPCSRACGWSGFSIRHRLHFPTDGSATKPYLGVVTTGRRDARAQSTCARPRRANTGNRGDAMIKTDVQLQRDVIDELRWDPSVGAAEIGVAVKNGVITLSGQVESFAKKYAAVRAVERVAGVRAVAEELTVVLPGSFKRTDTDLAHVVASTLKWDVQVPDEKVKARIEDGWVWLEGEIEWQYQSIAAERAVRNLTGVKGVTNLLQVKKRASIPDVKQHIENALKRHAE